MTTQESFNIIYKHLLTQNKKAEHLSDIGTLRPVLLDSNGNRCAIGAICGEIPVNENSFIFLPNLPALLVEHPGIFTKNIERSSDGIYLTKLGHDLMGIHDNLPVHHWKDALHNLAEKYGLEIPTNALSSN